MRPDGTGLRRLTSTPSRNEGEPAWSPDGARLLFDRWTKYDDVQLMTIDPSGRHPLMISEVSLGDAAWSPDGRWIAATGIVMARSDGSHPRNIIEGSQPAWRPEPCG